MIPNYYYPGRGVPSHMIASSVKRLAGIALEQKMTLLIFSPQNPKLVSNSTYYSRS
jgi:hypothetical protein